MTPTEGGGVSTGRLEQQLRFAGDRPGCPDASPRSHGVPRRDVLSRVNVSVASKTAGRANEARLALARRPIHVPARRAPLAREGGVDLLKSAGCLLLKPTHQRSPARPQDLAVQPGLLAYVAAGMPGRPSGRARHTRDLEVFDPDHVEPARDVGTGLLYPVLSPVGLAGAQPGDHVLHSRTAVRPAPCASEFALEPSQPLALSPSKAGDTQQFAGRQGGRHDHASVNAHGLAVARSGNRFGNGGERDVPAPGTVHGHAIGLRTRRHRARPAEPHPPDLRYPDLPGMPGLASYFPLPSAPTNDPEPLVSAGLPPSRTSGRVARIEERGHGLCEVPQCLLLYRLRACGQPRVLGAGLCELSALLRVAGRALSARVPVGVLLDGQVPHVPGVRAVFPQHCLLGRCGEQAIPAHTNTLSTITDISREVKRHFNLGPKVGVFVPRS